MSMKRWLRRAVEVAVPDSIAWEAPPRAEPTLYLTFDDGPHPTYTGAVLDVLRRYAVRASFFVSASEAEHYPELVLQLIAEGHGVANHGFYHMSARHLSSSGWILNAESAQRTLERIARCPLPLLYRPPHGTLGLRGFLALRRRGYRFVLWSCDSGDSAAGATVAGIVDRLAPERVSPGEIVLLHDDNAKVVEALPKVIQQLRAAGYEFARLDGFPRLDEQVLRKAA